MTGVTQILSLVESGDPSAADQLLPLVYEELRKLAESQLVAPAQRIDLLALDETLDKLALHDARKAELVKLRYFVGLTLHEAADVLGISESTAAADWAYAKAWLRVQVGD